MQIFIDGVRYIMDLAVEIFLGMILFWFLYQICRGLVIICENQVEIIKVLEEIRNNGKGSSGNN